MERELILKLNTGRIAAKLAKGEKTIVQNVSFSLSAGDSLALIGETGSGKTMIALSILGLLPKGVFREGGKTEYLGRSMPEGRRMRRLIGTKIVYIPQSGAESLDPSLTVKQQMTDGMKKNGILREEYRQRACDLLRRVGFSDPEAILSMYPFELSGGMSQRVAIALAAIGKPDLVIADEPTNGLDRKMTEDFFLLTDRLFENAARLVITHDISVASHCSRAIVLLKGRMCERGPAGQVLEKPRHPYTEALIGALVRNGMTETPVLRTGESLCPFFGRCPKALKICRGEPAFKQCGDTEWWCSGQ